MAIVITNPTPRQRFQESNQIIASHRELIGSREFQRAADYAIMQYCSTLSERGSANPNEAGVLGIKVVAAHEFLQTLRTLAESPPAVSRAVPQDNLQHTQ